MEFKVSYIKEALKKVGLLKQQIEHYKIKLDEKNIYDYLPELKNKNFNFSNLYIAQKVDYYRIFLLYKYGGLYLDADTLVL